MALRIVSNFEDSSLRKRKMGPQTEDSVAEANELELQTLSANGGSKTTVSASEVSESDIEFRGLDEATQIMIPSAHETTNLEPEETFWTIAIQVFFPFLIAGLGMVGAGLVLDIVQHWQVFKVVTELFILVPALLGLKGNLEMTLASRLSTQANLGRMNTPAEKWSLIKTNLALIQCQAIVVGFLASLAAVVMGWIPDGVFDIYHALVLCASSVVTASLASLVLGCVMVVVIVLSHRYQINPDNVATPIAASLGDLITLGLLSAVATILYNAIGSSHWWISACIMAIYVALLPLFVYITKDNEHTKVVLYTGWTPVLAAMMISSLGGLILDYTVSSYKGIAVFQPVINGVGGNLVAVQASRISTWLHRQGKPGRLPACTHTACLSPAAVFCMAGGHARTARVLLMLVVPGHLIFSLAINYLQAGHTSITPIFLIIYLLAASLQVLILLYVGHVMILWMWKRRIDPDNSAIPYLTAFGDLLGTAFLAVAFHILYLIGDRDSDVGD